MVGYATEKLLHERHVHSKVSGFIVGQRLHRPNIDAVNLG